MQFLIILSDMIFKQLFDDKSSTYTYILASDKGREALIIEQLIEHTNKYLNVLDELDLKLVKVIDTHIHADHVTGLNELSKKTNCNLVNVFVPTTPNPTSGFLLMFPKDEVIYIDLSFEEASKFIVSAGSINP